MKKIAFENTETANWIDEYVEMLDSKSPETFKPWEVVMRMEANSEDGKCYVPSDVTGYYPPCEANKAFIGLLQKHGLLDFIYDLIAEPEDVIFQLTVRNLREITDEGVLGGYTKEVYVHAKRTPVLHQLKYEEEV